MKQNSKTYLAEKHPNLREADKAAINSLFDAYIFRRRRTREIWTSCCRQHAILKEGDPLLDAPHIRGPRTDFGRPRCSHGLWSTPEMPKEQPTACPICGKIAEVKEIGRSGDRKNLWSFHRALVFRKQRGVLWALAYDTTKCYEGGDDALVALPRMRLIGIYRFDGKRAGHIGRPWWGGDCEWSYYSELERTTLARKWSFPEPFHWCNEYGSGYDVIGMDELNGTPYEYCGLPEYEKRHEDCARFLALCTCYPRQVEMLMKAGLDDIVQDRIDGKLNAKLLDWNEPNVLKSFSVPKEDLRKWLESDKSTCVMTAYKGFAKAKIPITLEQTQELYRSCGIAWFERLTLRMKRYGIGYQRMVNYLERNRDKRKKYNTGYETVQLWCDYIDAAAKIGYDLKNPVYLLPMSLRAKHDAAAKAAEAFAKTKDEKRARKRCTALSLRYTYWNDRYLIRPPVSAAEIKAEGEKLKHCVGGYAERHVNGSCTILFLRDKQRPGKPLVTIEMDGNHIVQIHGFKNEGAACRANPKCLPPREIYADLLEPWLEWLKAGSKRDKTGAPVMPKKRKVRVPA